VPGISLKLAFKGVNDNFNLFSKKHGDLVKLFLSQNTGGGGADSNFRLTLTE
jgi:hypothetical protein